MARFPDREDTLNRSRSIGVGEVVGWAEVPHEEEGRKGVVLSSTKADQYFEDSETGSTYLITEYVKVLDDIDLKVRMSDLVALEVLKDMGRKELNDINESIDVTPCCNDVSIYQERNGI